MTEFVIDARFNGPPASGNGGYTCGLVAGLVGTPAVEVTLRRPPPLGRPLEWDGSRLLDGDAVVAEGAPAELELPPPPTYDEADRASGATRPRGSRRGLARNRGARRLVESTAGMLVLRARRLASGSKGLGPGD